MEDKELYQHILGLETPWSVAEVKLDLDQQQIDIHVSHPVLRPCFGQLRFKSLGL